MSKELSTYFISIPSSTTDNTTLVGQRVKTLAKDLTHTGVATALAYSKLSLLRVLKSALSESGKIKTDTSKES